MTDAPQLSVCNGCLTEEDHSDARKGAAARDNGKYQERLGLSRDLRDVGEPLSIKEDDGCKVSNLLDTQRREVTKGGVGFEVWRCLEFTQRLCGILRVWLQKF